MEHKQKKRVKEDVLDKWSVPEEGGGVSNVEEKMSLSVIEMYERMLANGDMQKNLRSQANNHGAIERADAFMADAKPAPKYMKTGEIKEIMDKMKILEKDLRANNKAEAHKSAIDAEVAERLREQGIDI